jgi:WD40 repeat protein
VWTAEGGQQFEEVGGLQDDNVITDVQFSANGQRAMTWADHHVKVWDLQVGPNELLSTTAERASLSPDGRRVLTIDENHVVKIWDMHPAQELPRIPGRAAIYGGEPETVASILNEGIELWDARTGRKLGTLLLAPQMISIALSPDGRTLAGATASGLEIWDVHSQRRLFQSNYSAPQFPALAFNPSKPEILTTVAGGVIAWDLKTGGQLWMLDESAQQGSDSTLWQSGQCRASLAFSGDGRYFLTMLQGVATLRRSANQETRMVVKSTAERRYCSAALSLDAQRLVMGTEDGEIEIWETAQARQLNRAKAHRLAIVSVAFDDAGRRLATSGLESSENDSSVKVWDVNTLAPLLVLENRLDRAWHPTNSTLFDPTDEGSNVASGFGHRVMFSRDGKLLAVDSPTGESEDLYTLEDDDLLRLARYRLNSPLPLSPAECKTYLNEERCPTP